MIDLTKLTQELVRQHNAGPKLAGADGSETLPYVLAFAEQMERKLAVNRHKGDRDGWMSIGSEQLMRMLVDEVLELNDALRSGSPSAVVAEAADVANFAMMISDRMGGLSPTAPSSSTEAKHD